MIRLTPIVKNLLIVCGIVFIAQFAFGDAIREYVVLHPSFLIFNRGMKQEFISIIGSGFQPIQLVGYFFAHSTSDLFHIVFNMFFLVSLGPVIEMTLGPKKFLEFYLFCGVVGGILITLFNPVPHLVLGASVPLSGIMVAFAIYYPREKLGIMFLPIRFEARKFVIGIAVISVVLFVVSLFSPGFGGNISHFGHLMGMACGLLYFQIDKIKSLIQKR